jgi:hypothetical protein
MHTHPLQYKTEINDVLEIRTWGGAMCISVCMRQYSEHAFRQTQRPTHTVVHYF